MKGLVGLGSWLGHSVFLLAAVAAGSSSFLACSSSETNSGGSAGSHAADSAGTSATGGSAANAGAGGTAPHAGSPNTGGAAGGSPSAGAGAGGGSPAEKEVAVSLYSCKPDCPPQQYCALLGPECTTEPCLVRAVCRDRPPCGADLACPVEPANMCRDDPSDPCTPAAGMNCPGRCFCTEAAHSCSPQILDRRPNICSCVTPGTASTCLDVTCPGEDACEIILGKAYCISPS